MAETTKIQWAHHTFNCWRGCTKISPGCQHCYAEELSHTNPRVLGEWGDQGKRLIAAEASWRQPLKWDRAAAAAGERRRVFCLSLGDVFEDRPELVQPRYRLFDLIEATPHLDWLLLTKRPAFMRDFLKGTHGWGPHGLPNVWLGVSVEDQQRADERIPILLDVPARVRFLSMEPLLGPVDLRRVGMTTRGDDLDVIFGWRTRYHSKGRDAREGSIGVHCSMQDDAGRDNPTIDWVILGGESGRKARPCQLGWLRDIVDECRHAELPVFVKQLGTRPELLISHDGRHGLIPLTLCDPKGGTPEEWPEDLRIREFPVPREVPA